MKSITAKIFILFGLALCNTRAEVYKTTASMVWSIYVPNPSFLSTQDLFNLEEKTSEFLNEKLSKSPLFGDQNLYMTTFGIRSQSINPDLVLSKFDAQITILYEGKETKDLSAVLSNVIPNSEAELLLQSLVIHGHFGESSTSSMVEYRNGDSIVVASSSTGNKTLFIVLLVLVSVLILCSFGILISSIKRCRRKHVDNQDTDRTQGIKPSATMETADNSPSASPCKLGARKNVVPEPEGSAYAITPVRRGRNSQVSQTPMSQNSSVSDLISPASSTASRNPLGIMRLSTLNKVTHEPQNDSTNPSTMYKIPLHESSDDEESVIDKA